MDFVDLDRFVVCILIWVLVYFPSRGSNMEVSPIWQDQPHTHGATRQPRPIGPVKTVRAGRSQYLVGQRASGHEGSHSTTWRCRSGGLAEKRRIGFLSSGQTHPDPGFEIYDYCAFLCNIYILHIHILLRFG